MNKLWICVGCVALLGALGCADELTWDYDYYSDEIENDYANSNVMESSQKKLPDTLDTDTEEFKMNVDDSGEIIYDDEYEQQMKIFSNGTTIDIDDQVNKKNNERDDIDDYQIEDNRSEVKDDKRDSGELVENIDDIEIKPKDTDMDIKSDEIPDHKPNEIHDDHVLEDENDIYDEDVLEKEASEDFRQISANDVKSLDLSVSKEKTKAVPNNENNYDFEEDRSLKLDQGQDSNMKEVIGDTDIFLNKNGDDGDEFSYDELVNSNETQKLNIDQFIDETRRILEETNEYFDEDVNDDEKLTSVSNSTEYTEINSNSDTSLENKSNTSTEKYNIDDDTVAKAYSDLKNDLNNLRETWTKLKDDVTDEIMNKDNLPGFDEINTKLADMAQESQAIDDDYEVIEDKDLSTLFKEIQDEDIDNGEIDEIEEKEGDDVEPALPTSDVLNSDFANKSDQSKLIQYVDDALNANDGIEMNANVGIKMNAKDGIEMSNSDFDSSTKIISTTAHTVQVHLVEPLEDTPDDLFAIFSDSEPRSADPIRIALNIDTPVVLTSPNYPRPYPTNAVIDWILEGEGRGIEFNVTNFALNSIAGDYVMINPGRVDPSGNDGLLLTYNLKQPRAFRFLDVDRMFIRFDSKLGLNRFSGFSFSAKMINPLPEEQVLEPDIPSISYPKSTITLNLAGVTLESFLHIEEEFRQIVADMASMYIEMNQIAPGLNTTLEVTQITSTGLCFHNWPQFEQCAEVRFGVPLQYDDEEMEPRLSEEDLRDMWYTYSNQNPFALRLQILGITDFQIPNDGRVLMLWLVIAAGVVISMAMLAFALWRFSCFEDYTKMPAFSDTESINEKKTLDLYPTPHQTLPPLYSETEYKWGEAKYGDTTVDMSGFANRSYVRTEDYDFESEEEVAVPARDRYTTDV